MGRFFGKSKEISLSNPRSCEIDVFVNGVESSEYCSELKVRAEVADWYSDALILLSRTRLRAFSTIQRFEIGFDLSV